MKFGKLKNLVVDNQLLTRYDGQQNGYSYPEMVEGTGPVKPSNLLAINKQGANLLQG